MTLEEFKVSTDIKWDIASKTIYEDITAKSGDVNGRKMRVQVVDGNAVVDLTGYTLNLGWKNLSDPTKKGLDVFEVVDITKGIFEITYTTALLSNIGRLVAALQLVGLDDVTESNNFIITVKQSAIDVDAIQTESSFTALTEALVTVNQLNSEFDAAMLGWGTEFDNTLAGWTSTLSTTNDTFAQMSADAEAAYIAKSANLDATYPTRLLSVEQQLEQNDKRTSGWLSVKESPFNAVGDGIADDTTAIQSAINTGKSIFIPKGTYLVKNLIPKAGQVIFGENAVDSWGTSVGTSKTILKGMGTSTDYVIKNMVWDIDGSPYALNLRDLTIEGNTKTTNGIRCGNSTIIERCKIVNCIVGIYKVDVSRITNCQISGNTTGISEATDSKIDGNFIYNNETGINFYNSNDNVISNNKIEWNGIGINLDTAVFNLITGNIFDRQTTFGITSISTAYITVIGNQFERNLTNHIKIVGGYWNVNGNSFFQKNSSDDGSGTLVPSDAIFLDSGEYCVFSSNMIFGSKMFSSVYSNVLNNNYLNNVINGSSNILQVTIPSTVIAAGASTTLQIPYPATFGTNGYDVILKGYKLNTAEDSNVTYYVTKDVEIYLHNMNGVYVKITNNYAVSKTFSGTVWLEHTRFSKR